MEYNTNNGTKPVYAAKVVDGGATVVFEGWVGSDNTRSYSNYAAYRDDDEFFDIFKEGVTYSYGIRIAAKKGYVFSNEVKVKLNEKVITAESNSNHKMITLHNVYSKESVCEHVWINKKTKGTCLTDGYTTHTCKYCGYSYKDNYSKSVGQHNWIINEGEDEDEESKGVTLATDEDDGEILYICAVC